MPKKSICNIFGYGGCAPNSAVGELQLTRNSIVMLRLLDCGYFTSNSGFHFETHTQIDYYNPLSIHAPVNYLSKTCLYLLRCKT